MAVPMLRVAEALKQKRTKASGTRMFLFHQPSQVGLPMSVVAPGVRALLWQEFLNVL